MNGVISGDFNVAYLTRREGNEITLTDLVLIVGNKVGFAVDLSTNEIFVEV